MPHSPRPVATAGIIVLALLFFSEFILAGWLTLEVLPGLGLDGWLAPSATLISGAAGIWLISLAISRVEVTLHRRGNTEDRTRPWPPGLC